MKFTAAALVAVLGVVAAVLGLVFALTGAPWWAFAVPPGVAAYVLGCRTATRDLR